MIDLLRSRFAEVDFAGADIDENAIHWCRKALPGEYRLIDSLTLPFPTSRFDLVYAVSIFTHMDETEQWQWLAELRRVLKPGGLLVATTHSPHLIYGRPDLPDSERTRLNDVGFAFIAGFATFNERSAFHSREYIQKAWEPLFELLSHTEFGLASYQDIAVLKARA
jgi:SAM-dependent methyltransferase